MSSIHDARAFRRTFRAKSIILGRVGVTQAALFAIVQMSRIPRRSPLFLTLTDQHPSKIYSKNFL